MKTKHHHSLSLRILTFVILRCRFVSRIILSGCLAALGSSFVMPASAQVPNLVSYQGRVAVGTVNFEGTGQFRFALVNTAGTTVYWGNAADTTPADGVQDAAVSLPVSKGLYSVLLGDTTIANMATIPASVWTNADVRLRVWFNDGVNGNQLLTPDQRLAPAGYIADGSVASAAIATNAVTGPKIASNAVNSAKLASNLTLSGTTSGTFSGSGAGLTNLNGANLTAGSIGSTQLASGLTLGGTTSGTFSGNLTGNATTATNATSFTGVLAGDVTGTQSATSIGAGIVTGKALTGFSSTTGTITASDTILSAINKLDGNDALKAPIASPTFSGTVSGTFSGNGSALTNLNGASLTAGSISGTQLGSNLTLGGTTTGTFSGNGANLTSLNATNISSGTLADARLPTNVALRAVNNTFSGRTQMGELWLYDPHSGFGVSGTAYLEARDSTGTTNLGLQLRSQNAGTVVNAMRITPVGDIGIGTTIPSSKLQVAGTVTATAFIGNGSALTSLNGANLTSGSVGTSQLAANVGLWSVTGGDVYRSSGNVGIGTPAPGALLSLGSSVANSKLLLYDSGSFLYGMGIQNQQFRFHTSNANDRFSFLNGPNGTENVTFLGNGNVGIGTGSPATKLDVSGEITCVAINLTSDRNAKEEFKPVNAREVLDKVIGLPITEWQYKAREEASAESARHIGPMAQDFRAAFALGHDERHITSVDADGVALAAIQGLNAKLEAEVRAKDAALSRLERENQRLAERMAAIEVRLQATASLSKE